MSSKQKMFPAFWTEKPMYGFLLLLIFLVTMPLWVEFVTDPEDGYESIPRRMGVFSWHKHAIYDEDGPIDVAFVGGSGIWTAMDPAQLEKSWKTNYGEDVKFINLGHNWHGDLLDYIILHDLMENRDVNRVMLDAPIGNQIPLHPATKYVWRFWEHREATQQLSLRQFLALYAEKILVSPRLLYTKLVPPKPLIYSNSYIKQKGHNRSRRGYHEWSSGEKFEYDENLNTTPPTSPLAFIENNKTNAVVNVPERPNLAVREFTLKHAKSKDVDANLILMPRIDIFHTSVDLPKSEASGIVIGAPFNDIFPGLERDDYKHYFYNRLHLNAKGAEYYSNFLLPSIKHVLGAKTSKKPVASTDELSTAEQNNSNEFPATVNEFQNLIANIDSVQAGSKMELDRSCEKVSQTSEKVPGSCMSYFNSFDVIRIYPEKLSVISGDNVAFRFALQPNLEEGAITKIRLFGPEGEREPNIINSPKFVAPEICKSFFGAGCSFSQQLKLDTTDLSAGLYRFELSADNRRGVAYFAVSHEHTTKTDVSVIIPEFTAQAYNIAGGGSIYSVHDIDDDYKSRSFPNHRSRVSLSRPMSKAQISKVFDPLFETQRMLIDAGYSISFLSDTDLQKEGGSLEQNDTVLILGHHEYWTASQIRKLEAFNAKGGNIVNMSGNVLWYTVNYDNSEIFVDKGAKSRSQVELFANTGYAMYQHWKNRPEYHFGASYRYAGYPVKRALPNAQKEPLDEDVEFLCDHPIVKRIGLERGKMLESTTQVLQVELDGLPLNARDELVLGKATLATGSSIRPIAKGYSVSTSRWGRAPLNKKLNTALLLEYKPSEKSGRIITFGTIGFARAIDQSVPANDNAKQLLLASLEYVESPTDQELDGCNWTEISHSYKPLTVETPWTGNATVEITNQTEVVVTDDNDGAIQSMTTMFSDFPVGGEAQIGVQLKRLNFTTLPISLFQYNFSLDEKTTKLSLEVNVNTGEFKLSGSSKTAVTIDDNSVYIRMIVPAPPSKADVNFVLAPAYKNNIGDKITSPESTGTVVLEKLTVVDLP